jgi:hypothetical protein
MRYVSTIVCVRRWRVYTLPLRHAEEYFVKYQDIPLAKPTDGLKLESISWIIFGDGCVGHKCMDTTVTRSTT